jgi:4-oxalocrotonate tautomerase
VPLVNIKIIEGVLSGAQKAHLIHNLTEAVVAIDGEKLRDDIWVIIEEVKSGEWAVGGRPLTTGAVRRLEEG